MLSEIREIMKGNVLVLTVCSSLWRISIDIIWPYLALYVIALGGEYETVGQVMAVGNIASMMLYPLGGYIADYQGRIKVMGYMTYVYAFTFLIFVFTESWLWVAVGMFMQSLVTFYIPAMQALMADSIPAHKRGIGFAATMAIPGAFGVASPLIGGWLIEQLGVKIAVKGLYAAGFFVALIVATLRLKYLKEMRVRKGPGLNITVRRVPGLVLESYRDVLRTVKGASKPLLTYSVLVSSAAFFVSMVSPFWIIRAIEVIGLNTWQWGTLSLLNGTINVLLSFPAGRIVDRFNKRWVAGICLIACSIPCLLFLRATTFTHVALLLAACTIPNTFINPVFQAMFIDMTPPDRRGRMIAAIGGAGIWVTGGAWATGIFAMISITMGTLLSGYLYRFNNQLPWMILSAAIALIGVLMILLVKDTVRETD
ncbi:MFS transporter [Candidatus Bathyarchaeota archaeon]|nr:MAG: MFS transporter [Candidatus Bathyarchaeota archaeon]